MGSPAPRVRLSSLVREELRALPRNTFALAAIGIVFGLLAVPVSFLYTGEAGLEETLLFTWLVIPLVVAVVVAARVASARRTRFVDSLYTTPLRQPTWIAAQAIVGAILGLLVLAVQVPFLVVFVVWLGVPAILPPLALAALGVAAFAVALGLFCGVIVGDASPLAAAGLAGGIAFLSFILFLVHMAVLGGPPTASRDMMLRLTALSPVALAADVPGLALVGVKPVEAWRPIAGIVGVTAGLACAGWLAYTRAQGPLGWETRRSRVVIVALAAAAVLAPVATAAVAFEELPTGAYDDPGEHAWIAFVERGAPIDPSVFEIGAIASEPHLPVGQDVAVDMLVLVVAPEGATVRGVHVQVSGTDVVRVVDGGQRRVPSGEPDARVTLPDDDTLRPVYRVPLTLRALSAEELGNSPSPIGVRTEFTANGRTYVSAGQMVLLGDVPGALPQLLGMGLLLPGAALAGFVIRHRRTR